TQWAQTNGILYFIGPSTTGSGRELWRSDGTTAGTYIVRDSNPGTGHGIISNSALIAYNGAVYFDGADSGDGFSGGTLWRSDGTSAGTVRIYAANTGMAPAGFAVVGGKLIYSALQTASLYGLYTTDGTIPGTTMLASTPNSGRGVAIGSQ